MSADEPVGKTGKHATRGIWFAIRARWGRPVAVALSVVIAILATFETGTLLMTSWGQGLIASDVVQGYLPGALRFLSTGSPYTPEQVAGPWSLAYHSFIHPPVALALFVPFLVLPLFLWWAAPAVVTAVALRRLHPADWTWPMMAVCLLWPRSVGSIVAGNSDIWAMNAVAAGAAWGWPIVLLAVKPTFAPLGLVAIRRPSAWRAAALVAVLSIPTLPLWVDWVRVLTNANLSWTYSLANLPLVALPAVAWLGRRSPDKPEAAFVRPHP